MHTAYLVITILFASLVSFSGVGKIRRDPRQVKVVHETVGVPLKYLPLLAACEFAGALGLVTGIWLPSLAVAAGVGLVLYFVGAVVSHLRVGDVKGIGGAAFMLVIVSLTPTLIYYIILYQLGNPEGNIDTPGVIGSFTGMILLGGVFCSIGVLSSSITSNQIVSFIIAAFFCYAFYTGVDSLASLFSDGRSSLFVRQFGILYHYESLSKGLIDSRDLVYFFSIAGLMLLSTKTVLSSRSW